MKPDIFEQFSVSPDTLWIYQNDSCLFSSDKGMLFPLLEYIAHRRTGLPGVVVLDKVIGNAAALLAIRAGAVEVYSPLGSRLAIETLLQHRIDHHLNKVVPISWQITARICAPWKDSPLARDLKSFTSSF